MFLIYILVIVGVAFICAANALSAGMHGQFHDLLMEMKSEVVNEQVSHTVCNFGTFLISNVRLDGAIYDISGSNRKSAGIGNHGFDHSRFGQN